MAKDYKNVVVLLLSGMYPNEHGWLGWDVYYPQLDKNVTVFMNTDQIR